MIHFLTPLAAKKSVVNWELTCDLLHRTIQSLQNQTCSEFRSIICCHDIPQFAEGLDERFQFVEHPFNPPEDARTISGENNGVRDMMLKRDVALYFADPDPGDFLFLLDADDLLHTDVVREIVALPETNGVLLNSGYEFCQRSKRLLQRSNMVSRSGTSFALSGRLVVPPSSLDEEDLKKTLYHSVWHSNVIEYLEEGSHPHTYLEGERVIYRTNTSLNHSDWFRRGKLIRTAKHRLKYMLGRRVTPEDKKNFRGL